MTQPAWPSASTARALYVKPAVEVVIVAWEARLQPIAENVIDDWAFCGAVAGVLRAE